MAGLPARLLMASPCLTWHLRRGPAPNPSPALVSLTLAGGPTRLIQWKRTELWAEHGFGCREEVGVAEGTLETLWGTHGEVLFLGPA